MFKVFLAVGWRNLRYCIVTLRKELAGIVNYYFDLISTNNQAKRVIRHFTPVNNF